MKLITLLLSVMLLQSCGWSVSRRDSRANANESALYDPPTVSLIEGETYKFVEGSLVGRGQKFHSDWSYRRAIIVGSGE